MNIKLFALISIMLLVAIPVIAARKNYGYKLAGDVNKDCYVNILDIGTSNPYYGRERGDKPENFAGLTVSYRGWADLNKDGVIDMLDVQIISDNWGNTCNL